MPVQAIYIDVDLTLIDADGKVYPGVAAALQRYRRMYSLMVCWSHTGGPYAKKTCTDNKLDQYFDLFLHKPDIIIDDDPQFLLKYAHILKVDNKAWWLEAMTRLYGKKVDTKVQAKLVNKRGRK